jgi:hypothetical protein
MSGETMATEGRKAEFKVEGNSEEALILLLLAWFKSRMIQCEIAYQQGDKQALMVALEICLGVWLPAGRPLPEWIGREFNAAIATIPKSWDDVFGKPLRSNSRRAHTAFSVMQEHHASAGDMVATIADKIGRSYGTARALYYDDDYLQKLTRGKALAEKYGLRIQNPVWNEYLIYALGFGYLVPVLESGTLDILFYPAGGCGILEKS